MKAKAIIPLLLGLGVGVVTVKLAVDTIRKAQAANKGPDKITAVRAKMDIEAFEEITPEMVEVVETADSLFAPAAERIASIEELKDRVAAKSIPERSAVLKSMLAPEGTRPGMVGRIPPGFRAVSVKIDEVTGVAYQIKPGDWVDVIVVMDIQTNVRGKKDTIAEVILQHVQVAAIGHETGNQPAQTSSKVKPAKSATLLVSEEDVPKLHLAGTRGKITLAMRGDDDGKREPAPSASMDDVLAMMTGAWGGAKKANVSVPDEPIPAKRSSWMEPEVELDPPHEVLVRRGSVSDKTPSEFETITFENAESPNIVEVSVGLPSRNLVTGSRERINRSRGVAPTSRGESETRPWDSRSDDTEEGSGSNDDD